jgi:hypothetical protein
MEGYRSAGQSPQWAVVPTEQEEEFHKASELNCSYGITEAVRAIRRHGMDRSGSG